MEQTYRIEVSFDFTGSKEAAIKAAKEVEDAVGKANGDLGHVEMLDEDYEEVDLD